MPKRRRAPTISVPRLTARRRRARMFTVRHCAMFVLVGTWFSAAALCAPLSDDLQHLIASFAEAWDRHFPEHLCSSMVMHKGDGHLEHRRLGCFAGGAVLKACDIWKPHAYCLVAPFTVTALVPLRHSESPWLMTFWLWRGFGGTVVVSVRVDGRVLAAWELVGGVVRALVMTGVKYRDVPLVTQRPCGLPDVHVDHDNACGEWLQVKSVDNRCVQLSGALVGRGGYYSLGIYAKHFSLEAELATPVHDECHVVFDFVDNQSNNVQGVQKLLPATECAGCGHKAERGCEHENARDT